jgi:hypothetical protein
LCHNHNLQQDRFELFLLCHGSGDPHHGSNRAYCGSEPIRHGYHCLDHGSSGSTTRVHDFPRPTVNSQLGSFLASISLSSCSP